MKAIVKFADGEKGFGLRDVAVPTPRENELLIRVRTVGICGTDMHIVRDEYPHVLPVTLGHEFVGSVEALGENARGFRVGDTVVSLACAYTCGECAYCRAGLPMMCPERRSIGSWKNGAMAEYVAVPYTSCFPVAGAPTDEMAAYEPLACCVRAVLEVGAVRAEDLVFVSGAGFMGQLSLQLAKQAGARVVVSGLPSDAERLALAKRMGADATVTSASEMETVLRDMGAEGFDVCFECAAAAASLANCVRFCKRRGRIVQVGLFGKPVPVDVDGMLYKEISLQTSFGSNPSSWTSMLDIVSAGGVALKPYLENIVPFADWETAFAMTASGKYYKVLMRVAQ